MSGLTEFEKQYFSEGFRFLDKNKDDKVEKNDLGAMLKALKFDLNEQQIVDMIQVADSKKDGTVRYEDFLARFVHKDMGELEAELQQAFEIVDMFIIISFFFLAGENVKISTGDLQAFFNSIGEEVNDEELKEIMDMAGTDGKLSKEEFIKMLHV
ncbi:centrin, EF-hand protein, 1 [Reticulomyxa filosa]|uniref:Calmodulin n=1 Tax=Reticulomyxa filosa TaxID=46433 RepID=X6M4X6_RETFI|nr:centrin, EF-hand protein, 1 [Reticulomyxa filosa]|eukprot:ETO08090.1 centrin, EF-hand protein, 1 [Reticulomyxa filosa]